ncbi:MAG: FAD-dependent oxidoreductase [Clostridia bacterium]|nr:FAD-dependent oxidoreductase [Clostridia bacterium]
MKKYDLIVVGGGISGVAASVAAGREGLSVLLIEKYGSLGGAMTASLVYPFLHYTRDGGKHLLSDGLFTEMRNRFKEYNDESWECYKLVFDDMVTEAGVEVLFHSTVFEAKTIDRKVKKLKVATKSGVFEFEADFFIDTTGDGELIAMTDCDCQLGRESDSLCQPMTTCFRVSGVDRELFMKDKEMLQEKYKEWQRDGKINNPRENILEFGGPGNGIIHFNTTRIVMHNPVDPFDISRAEIEARKQISEMMVFFKANSKAFEKSNLVSIAHHIGVRESRKLKGVHILTQQELKDCTAFEDTIALGNYPIDIHNPEGKGTTLYYFKDEEFYHIPYRSLLPKEYDNMLVAGRCLSATHEAHSAVRIMPICACMGQAAGIAIALACKTTKNTHTIDISTLRTMLKENGAAI